MMEDVVEGAKRAVVVVVQDLFGPLGRQRRDRTDQAQEGRAQTGDPAIDVERHDVRHGERKVGRVRERDAH